MDRPTDPRSQGQHQITAKSQCRVCGSVRVSGRADKGSRHSEERTWIRWDFIGSGSTGTSSERLCYKSSLGFPSHFPTNCKAIILVFQAKFYLSCKGPEFWHGFCGPLPSCVAPDSSPGCLELVSHPEGTKADPWFSDESASEPVKGLVTHIAGPTVGLGPENLHF